MRTPRHRPQYPHRLRSFHVSVTSWPQPTEVVSAVGTIAIDLPIRVSATRSHCLRLCEEMCSNRDASVKRACRIANTGHRFQRMKTHNSSTYPRSSRRRARLLASTTLAVGACCSVLVCAPFASAHARVSASAKSALASASPDSSLSLASPYGEESRFGGYDTTGNTPGKFVHPVGFAVDSHDTSTSDDNAVYVLDETIASPANELAYRLQKLSSSGAVLGSVILPVQKFVGVNEAHPLISLAVDSKKHRVYALVESLVNELPVASELVAWSTIPNASKELVRASGYPEDTITHASLVAGSAVLQPGGLSTDLFAPEGLTVDPSNHDVIIEAQHGATGSEGGPTILQRVATEGSKSGQLDGEWTASSSAEVADGVFTGNSGGFGIDQFHGFGAISSLSEVKANFEKPESSAIAPDGSGGVDIDQAATIDNKETVNRRLSPHSGQEGFAALLPYTAGSPATQLSNGLYAARFGSAFRFNDPQSEVAPWEGIPYFWVQTNDPSTKTANMGVRLFTSSGAVVTTIGGQPEGQPCNLNFAPLAVAAGAKESVFVLTQPNGASSAGITNDEVVEFKPGGKGACPQPSGSLTLNGQSGTSFTFPAGENVTFEDSVERKGEAPYRFDWVLLNASTLEAEDLDNQMEAPEYLWPAPSKSHTFSKKGTYYLAATLYGEYGVVQIGEVVEIKVH
jgi:hypothetical protein